MSPETFTLAIIATIGTSIAGIIIGVVTSRKSSAEIGAVKAHAVQAKATAIDTNAVVTQKADETLSLIKELSQQLTQTLEQQNGDLRDDVRSLKELASNQAKQLTQIVANNAVIRDENAGLRLDVNHFKDMVDDLESKIAAINQERVQEKTYIKALEKTILDLKEAQEKSCQEYQRLLSDQGETLAATKGELDARLKEIAALNAQVAEIGDLRERVEALEKAVKEMTEERDQLVKRISELEIERDAAIKRAEQAERERDDLKAQLATEKKKQTDKLPSLPESVPSDNKDTPHA